MSDEEYKRILSMKLNYYIKKNQKTQKEVADKMGISQSYISRLEKKIIDKLKIEMDKKLTIFAKKWIY